VPEQLSDPVNTPAVRRRIDYRAAFTQPYSERGFWKTLLLLWIVYLIPVASVGVTGWYLSRVSSKARSAFEAEELPDTSLVRLWVRGFAVTAAVAFQVSGLAIVGGLSLSAALGLLSPGFGPEGLISSIVSGDSVHPSVQVAVSGMSVAAIPLALLALACAAVAVVWVLFFQAAVVHYALWGDWTNLWRLPSAAKRAWRVKGYWSVYLATTVLGGLASLPRMLEGGALWYSPVGLGTAALGAAMSIAVLPTIAHLWGQWAALAYPDGRDDLADDSGEEAGVPSVAGMASCVPAVEPNECASDALSHEPRVPWEDFPGAD
jgi:hypothetical protein